MSMINRIKKVMRRGREGTSRSSVGREKIADTEPVRTLKRTNSRARSKNMFREVRTSSMTKEARGGEKNRMRVKKDER